MQQFVRMQNEYSDPMTIPIRSSPGDASKTLIVYYLHKLLTRN